jgi:hypothetical protein
MVAKKPLAPPENLGEYQAEIDHELLRQAEGDTVEWGNRATNYSHPRGEVRTSPIAPISKPWASAIRWGTAIAHRTRSWTCWPTHSGGQASAAAARRTRRRDNGCTQNTERLMRDAAIVEIVQRHAVSLDIETAAARVLATIDRGVSLVLIGEATHDTHDPTGV